MDRVKAAQNQYETEQGFPSPEYESLYEEGRARYIARRQAFHLSDPEDCDLDILAYEDGHLSHFIQRAPGNLLEAATSLLTAIEKLATELAEEDADDATDDEIINTL